jgi:hypothetical protein
MRIAKMLSKMLVGIMAIPVLAYTLALGFMVECALFVNWLASVQTPPSVPLNTGPVPIFMTTGPSVVPTPTVWQLVLSFFTNPFLLIFFGGTLGGWAWWIRRCYRKYHASIAPA